MTTIHSSGPLSATPVESEEAKASSSKRRYGGASAQERQAQRRERLLEAAFDIFGTEGYTNTTMRLICAKARLTERYFYENFDSVQALFVQLHKRVSAECAVRIEQSRSALTDEDPLAKSRASVRAFLEYIKEDPRRSRILLTDAVTTGLASVGNVNARVSHYVPVLRARIDKLFPHLDLDLDLEMVASGLIGLIVHTATLWAERGFETPVEKVLDHILFAWSGLAMWLAQNNKPPKA